MAIQQLNSKLVLVTGAASGIGLEIALAFARQGAHLLLVDVNPAALENARIAVSRFHAQCRTYPEFFIKKGKNAVSD